MLDSHSTTSMPFARFTWLYVFAVLESVLSPTSKAPLRSGCE